MAYLLLVRAIQNGEPVEKIRELADEAAEEKSLNRRNNERHQGQSALEAALDLSEENPDEAILILHLLLDRGANASSLSISEIIGIASLGDQTLFHKFIEHGMDIDSQERRILNTPLLQALLEYGEMLGDMPERVPESGTAIRILLGEHPEVELQNKRGNSALHLAASMPTHFIMEILPQLITPNTINLQNNEGMTPLMMYANRQMFQLEHDEIGPDEFVNFLLQHGANVLERDNQGRTARDLAVARNNEELAEILRQKEQAAREQAQGVVVQRGRQGERHRVPPGMARRITNFLGGKRKTRKGRTIRKGRKGRKTRHRR